MRMGPAIAMEGYTIQNISGAPSGDSGAHQYITNTVQTAMASRKKKVCAGHGRKRTNDQYDTTRYYQILPTADTDVLDVFRIRGGTAHTRYLLYLPHCPSPSEYHPPMSPHVCHQRVAVLPCCRVTVLPCCRVTVCILSLCVTLGDLVIQYT